MGATRMGIARRVFDKSRRVENPAPRTQNRESREVVLAMVITCWGGGEDKEKAAEKQVIDGKREAKRAVLTGEAGNRWELSAHGLRFFRVYLLKFQDLIYSLFGKTKK